MDCLQIRSVANIRAFSGGEFLNGPPLALQLNKKKKGMVDRDTHFALL